MKLHIACGWNKLDGFVNTDISPEVKPDTVLDALAFPWKGIADDSVSEIHVSHFLEHIPHEIRGHPGKDGLTLFMEECYRVMLNTGKLRVKFPYAFSHGAVSDPTHHRYMTPYTMGYYSKEWRRVNNLSQYDIKTDFEYPQEVIERKVDIEGKSPVPHEQLVNIVFEIDMSMICRKPL